MPHGPDHPKLCSKFDMIQARINPRERECVNTRNPLRGLTEPDALEGRSDVKTVPLHGKKAAGRVALVDDGDYDLVMQYRWHVIERRYPSGRVSGPYASTSIWRDGRDVNIQMHKLITGWRMTDHANGNCLDNQRSNLRPANHAQNNHNSGPRRGASSQFKGVTWHKKNRKWQAEIKVDGKRRYLGCFATEEAAAEAYRAASLACQGEYAYATREAGAA